MKDEELVELLQHNFDRESRPFKILFKRCTKKLYTFLINKGYSKYDSEDVLMDYFGSYSEGNLSSQYEKAIHSFDPKYSCKFVNYIKRILILRMISRNYKVKQERSVISESVNKEIGDRKGTEKIDFVGQDDLNLNNIILEEIKENVITHIYEIENENQKLAVICKLCLPFKITVSEIAEILEIKERTLSTYLYRGIENLSKKIEADPKLKNLSYEDDILKFIDMRLLHLNRSAIHELFDNEQTIKIFEKLLYEGKSIEEISEIVCINILGIKKIVKEGILKLISNKKYLLH